jgi:Animal haem peroxidase
MDIRKETPGQSRAKFWFVFALFLVLMAIAHISAELQARLGAHATQGLPALAALDYRAIFTIWASILLLAPALCFHVFSKADASNSYWRDFWTFAYLAFLVHVYWTAFAMFQLNWSLIFNSELQKTINPVRVVEHAAPDLFLAAWWGLDVVLAWLVPDHKWVRVQRGAVHLLAFIMFFAAFTLAAKASIVAHILGIVMLLAVGASFLLSVVIRESDPKSLMSVAYIKAFQLLNLFVVWHKLPTFLAVANLAALRDVLRAKNLHNTSDIAVTNPSGLRSTVPFRSAFLTEREEDGQYNDLSKPTMGNASINTVNPLNNSEFTLSNPSARFGRNIPLSEVDPTRDAGILEPSPRLVSNRLLARQVRSDGTDDFKPAAILNLLAAAWIQFQTHDWFNHGAPRSIADDPFDIPLPPGDLWPNGKMLVRRTRPDPTRKFNDGSGPVTYANAETHWWDSSQIYGDSPIAGMKYRCGQEGKLRIDPKTKLIPLDPTGVEKTGLTSNWWLGLSLLHNLFTLEHNAICDHLLQAFPEWKHRPNCDDDVFRAARLVNSALMAKIHTVDWTTAILTHPALQVGMNANWSGLAGAAVKKTFGRISESEEISGIPGSATNQTGADYCLTEEFVSVYRLHPLLPNDIQILFAADGRKGRLLKFESNDPNDSSVIVGPDAMSNALGSDGTTFLDLVYSFGTQCPGAVTLRNFPNWMRRMHRRNGPVVEELIDLATIDILRDRERGVPRYNRFRELFHMARVNSFEQMTDDPDLARELREVYGHPDKVDLMVGMYAENPPEGFGFSDTAFRVFILMASRRIKSDRYFTADFTPAVYTQPGMDWIDNNNMITVLLRHFPELAPVLMRTRNAFAPWKRN